MREERLSQMLESKYDFGSPIKKGDELNDFSL